MKTIVHKICICDWDSKEWKMEKTWILRIQNFSRKLGSNSVEADSVLAFSLRSRLKILATNPRMIWFKPLRWLLHWLRLIEQDFTNRISDSLIAMCPLLVFACIFSIGKNHPSVCTNEGWNRKLSGLRKAKWRPIESLFTQIFQFYNY